jgi:two-component system LytT family response regulator
MNRGSKKPVPQRLRAILVDDELLARTHLSNRLLAHPEIEIAGEADDVPSAFALVLSTKPDLIFLDIQMPKKNGFCLLPKLEVINPQPAVVFVTAYDEYAIRAFEANALDYLTKPVSTKRLAKTISRLIKRESHHSVPSAGESTQLGVEDLVHLRNAGLSMMVKVFEIKMIESMGDYTRVLLTDGEGKERKVLMKQTLSKWESQLPSELFSKVSRSLLVNMKSVSRLVKLDSSCWEIHLEGTKGSIKLSNLESRRLRKSL